MGSNLIVVIVGILLLDFGSAKVRGRSSKANAADDPSSHQLIHFKESVKGPALLTTNVGAPVEHREANNTANTVIFENEFLLDTLSHFDRERIPERVFHARGAGAFGTFEVTHDVTQYTKAAFLNKVGKKTPIVVRFATGAGERGSADTMADVRAFAIKFYTEEGNMDFAGLDFPIFFIEEPLRFPSLVHALKNNPVTNLKDPNMIWDFATIERTLFNMFILFFSDYSTPDGYRHIDGYPIHTYELENANGDIYYVKFHFKTDQGLKNLPSEEAVKLAGSDPGYSTHDLYNAIANGKYPSWTIYMQVMDLEQLQSAGFNPMSILRTWPNDTYPLQQVGRFVLNRNPTNYFEEIEQAAFCPGNLVPGILGSPDRFFQSRKFSYKDSQYHRLGTNFVEIPVNKPLSNIKNYNRDGAGVRDNEGGSPNYYPNSFNGPKPYVDKNRFRNSLVGTLKARELSELDDGDLFAEARNLYTNFLSAGERKRLAKNIAASLGQAEKYIQQKALDIFDEIDGELSNNIRVALRGNN